jgi:hypothetical protein
MEGLNNWGQHFKVILCKASAQRSFGYSKQLPRRQYPTPLKPTTIQFSIIIIIILSSRYATGGKSATRPNGTAVSVKRPGKAPSNNTVVLSRARKVDHSTACFLSNYCVVDDGRVSVTSPARSINHWVS